MSRSRSRSPLAVRGSRRALAVLAGLAGFASVALLAGACTTEAADTSDTSAGSEPVSVVGAWGRDEPGQPNLEFADDGRFAGTDGCNRLFGAWEQEGAEVSFSMVGTTKMFCEGVDTWLERLHSGRVNGDALHISNEAGDEIGALSHEPV